MATMDTPSGNSEQLSPEMKKIYRKILNVWHPDRSGDLGFVETPAEIIAVINNVFSGMKKENIRDLQTWPSDFKDGTKVNFTRLESEDAARTIFIPRTPQEFFDLLRYIENNRAFPKKEFPKVRIVTRAPRDDSARENDTDRDPGRADFEDAFAKYKDSLSNNANIDQLMNKMQALDVLPPGYAEAHKLLEKIDGQGEYLINGAFTGAESGQDFLDAFDKLSQFEFSDPEIRPQLMQMGAQYAKAYFMGKMKRAASEKGLDSLIAEVGKFYERNPFVQNDRDEIQSWIDKKRASYAEIWAKRKDAGEN